MNKVLEIKVTGSGTIEEIREEFNNALNHLSGYTKEELNNGGELEGPMLIVKYSEYEPAEELNPYQKRVKELTEEIVKEVKKDGMWKKSTCDCIGYGWDPQRHTAYFDIQRQGIEGITISNSVSWGVTDWTFRTKI